jgi:hypothetical protein
MLTSTNTSSPLGATLDISQSAHSVRIFKIVNTSIPEKAPEVVAKVAHSGTAGESIIFHAAPTDDNNPVLHYAWNFGDGVTMEGADVTHAYTHAGVFTVHLEAAGFASKPSTQTFSIAITGTITTKYLPGSKRRFVDGQP